jgi:hypothetical protein
MQFLGLPSIMTTVFRYLSRAGREAGKKEERIFTFHLLSTCTSTNCIICFLKNSRIRHGNQSGQDFPGPSAQKMNTGEKSCYS